MPTQSIHTNALQNIIKNQGKLNTSQNNMQERIQPAIPMQIEPQKEKKKLTDVFEKISNPPDMNDTVQVPRTIFKGYLSFMVGTSLLTLANIFKKVKKLSIGLTALGTLATIFGTYSFVKPYVLKEHKPE